MTTQRIHVRSAAGPYDVVYGSGLISRLAATVHTLGKNTGVFLLSSPRVAQAWGAKLKRGLSDSGLRATILFDDRETKKNVPTVELVCRELVRAGADRHALLIAAGGGVVGDVSGFVAASYLRGVRLMHVPTTVVAQVDSAIGGKTGVNLPEGKNLVGAFYSPQTVLADPETLATLPDREFRSGIYEIVKYGVIGDRQLFSYLEKQMEALIARNRDALDFVIPRCIAAKARVVSRDERESGLREILNFGHTFAHALETATEYRTYLHGEAVGWGMIAAARLAVCAEMFDEAAAARVEKLVQRVGPLPGLPTTKAGRLFELMRSDKKTRGGAVRFVLPRAIGKVQSVSGISPRMAADVLDELRDELSAPIRAPRSSSRSDDAGDDR
jgi:3-dehydroquinate synthase